MATLQSHLRSTFLAGIFSAAPVAVTIFIVWYIDKHTRIISEAIFKREVPFVGILVATAAIYLLGLAVTSIFGKWFLNRLDALLTRIPVLKDLYAAWKQVSLTPGGKEGIFARVVLVPVENGDLLTLGFTSGDPIPGDPASTCVFVPAAPNPMNGRLYFVRLADCRFLDCSTEEAFKWILSTGNYIPPQVAPALTATPASP